jgi:hypothetical protein
VSISYRGHCRLAPGEAQRLIDEARAAHPDWFAGLMRLSDTRPPPEPFGAEISRDFGIEAQSWFALDVIDKERFGRVLDDAIDDLYRRFSPGNLVMTWELDRIRPPRSPSP